MIDKNSLFNVQIDTKCIVCYAELSKIALVTSVTLVTKFSK